MALALLDFVLLILLLKPVIRGVDWRVCAGVWTVAGVVLVSMFSTFGPEGFNFTLVMMVGVLRLGLASGYFFLLQRFEEGSWSWVTLVLGAPFMLFVA